MRRSLWSFGIAGLTLGIFGMVGGTAIGGPFGSLSVGYGLVVALCALYLVAGLAVRERVWKRLSREASTPRADRLAGRRVF